MFLQFQLCSTQPRVNRVLGVVPGDIYKILAQRLINTITLVTVTFALQENGLVNLLQSAQYVVLDLGVLVRHPYASYAQAELT